MAGSGRFTTAYNREWPGMDHRPWIQVTQAGRMINMNTAFAQATGRAAHEVKLVSRETRRLVRLSGASRPRGATTTPVHPVALSALTAARAHRI